MRHGPLIRRRATGDTGYKTPITVAAVGDVQVGDSASRVGFGIASRYGGPTLDRVFKPVQTYLEADIAIGNLESVLSRKGLTRETWWNLHMRGHPQHAAVLRRASLNVLNVANNHSFQHGQAAFDDMVSLLRAEGIGVCGVRGDGEWGSDPLILETRDGQAVGCLGYCMRPQQYGDTEPPYARGCPKAMMGDISRLARRVDHVLVSLHWGEEFVAEPSRSEVRLADDLLSAGATAVLGHHPHVTRPIVFRDHRLIAFSLGNFATDMVYREDLRNGMILRFNLSDEGATDISTVLTRVDDEYRIVPIASAVEDSMVVEKVEGLDETEYRDRTAARLRDFRRSKYLHAIRNAHRYPLHLFGQLLFQTARNRLRFLRH